MMNVTAKLAVVALAAAMATGCATKQQTGALVGGIAGAAVLGPVGGVAAAHIALGVTGAVVGSIIGGEIGKKMDERDHMMVAKSVETSTTQTWTSKSGSAMSATTTDVAPDKKEVTVTSDGKTEKSTVVKKQGKWIKE